MEFEVTILGTSSALPTSERYPTAQVLNVLGQFFLIDCGEGTQIQMRKSNISLQKINQIFISHLHGDHYFGIFGYLSSLSLLGRTKELQIFGPKGLKNIIEQHLAVTQIILSFSLDIFEFEFKQGERAYIFENNVMKVAAFELKHSIPCLGFVFEEVERKRKIIKDKIDEYKIPIKALSSLQEGKDFITSKGEIIKNELLTNPPLPSRKYAFCTDTSYYPSIVPFIYKADLLYHETTFLEKDKERANKTGHSTTLDAGKIAKQAKVKKLLVGHYSTRYGKIEPFLEETVKLFENTTLAKEGLRISIPLQN